MKCRIPPEIIQPKRVGKFKDPRSTAKRWPPPLLASETVAEGAAQIYVAKGSFDVGAGMTNVGIGAASIFFTVRNPFSKAGTRINLLPTKLRGQCFVAGTHVVTAEGSAEIESIEVDTLVVARDVLEDDTAKVGDDVTKPSAQRASLDIITGPRLDARPRFPLPTPVDESSQNEHDEKDNLINRTSSDHSTKEASHE